jgi:hypothetical protein
MDPATIGLLISIAPTVLDLLFGRGSDIKHEIILENPEKMYGYGLEGYGLEGEGLRYPPISGYYEEPTTIATIQKEGPRKGMQIKRYLPKVDERWIATYLLNKRIAARNKWREYATEALQQASKKYLEELKKNDPVPYARAEENRQERSEKRKNATCSTLRRS